MAIRWIIVVFQLNIYKNKIYQRGGFVKNTQDDTIAIWNFLATKIRGRGKVLSEKETEVSITPGKRSGEVNIVLDLRIMRKMEKMITDESKKLAIKNDKKHHLLRYLAFCGGVAFSPHKIVVPDVELLHALSYIFGRVLRRIKRERVDEEKEVILDQAKEIVPRISPKSRVTSVYYGSGLYNVKISGLPDPVKGRDYREVIFNLKKIII